MIVILAWVFLVFWVLRCFGFYVWILSGVRLVLYLVVGFVEFVFFLVFFGVFVGFFFLGFGVLVGVFGVGFGGCGWIFFLVVFLWFVGKSGRKKV